MNPEDTLQEKSPAEHAGTRERDHDQKNGDYDGDPIYSPPTDETIKIAEIQRMNIDQLSIEHRKSNSQCCLLGCVTTIK